MKGSRRTSGGLPYIKHRRKLVPSLKVGSDVTSQELMFLMHTYRSIQLVVRARKSKSSPETASSCLPRRGRGKREGGGWDVGGGSDAGMDMPPAGTAAWVGKIRCALQPHPQRQLSCGFSRRVLGILSAAPYHHSQCPHPTPPHSLLFSRQRGEGRGNGGLSLGAAGRRPDPPGPRFSACFLITLEG